METVLILLRDICFIIGSLFILCGSIGILRFPDFFTRIHAAGVTETAGMGFILIGLLIESGIGLVSLKILIIMAFMIITSPTASHALAKAAAHGKHDPFLKSKR